MAHPGSGSAGASRAGAARSTPGDGYLRHREQSENFPVALRVLPREPRTHLRAVYDVARVIDDLGDRGDGDRTAALLAFRADLATVWRGGTPRADVLRRLVPTVRACDLPQEPFDDLVRANLQDQRVDRYATYADLRAYCTLSADPVGRIVLAVFGAGTPRAVELSDRVCTALQLVEHWQDVAEDRRAGRVYLPQEDLAAFGVPESDLDLPQTSPRLRRLMAYETDRAEALLDSGTPLLGLLRGWARLAVTGYVAGGRAAIDGLRKTNWAIMSGSPGTSRLAVLRHLSRGLVRRVVP
ncbi:squalene synthase HpnC [Phytohabitans sp. ZYX-F-186]|uniref:Squalene synthase HpnC n=1 Tax=Phytohabitans maris TaxID=3071409 RepID=A0ABU0ZII8_9ACTN|nr:squalene synthase HpnC [Phytohabitans sp. ZYX-F-186]MDQ7905767.1 squalene synthase HpnC [Phytohabitans sp. ZYX-F-186]